MLKNSTRRLSHYLRWASINRQEICRKSAPDEILSTLPLMNQPRQDIPDRRILFSLTYVFFAEFPF